MNTKPWYRSRTMWLGIGVGVLAFVAAIDPGLVSDNPRVVMLLGAMLSALTVALRVWTHTSIE